MPSIHEVLRWANRTAVAQEVTERGYRVSPETLNRWYRQRSEVPAIVERIVFELFGVGTQQEAAPPEWAERLLAGVMALESKGDVSDAELVAAEARAAIYLAASTRKRPRQGHGGAGSASSA